MSEYVFKPFCASPTDRVNFANAFSAVSALAPDSINAICRAWISSTDKLVLVAVLPIASA